MKFRYKVLIMNVILLTASLGIVGYLMIRKNFDIAQRTGLSNAIMENNLIQSSVEYDLLQVLNGSEYQENKSSHSRIILLRGELKRIGNRLRSGLMAANTSFYIRYDNSNIYGSVDETDSLPSELFNNNKVGEKKYIFSEEEGKYYIYVSSCSRVEEEYLCVVNRSDVTESYDTLTIQIWYFRIVILVLLAVASILIYMISRYLTGPLEQLTKAASEIARENYAQRVEVRSGDEVGQLAGQFNHMAGAVEEHVEQLHEMLLSREQFVADFTHEIKTPMTTIIGYADTMRSMELPRQQQILALNYIFSEGKRLEDMSGKLFQLLYLKRNEVTCVPLHVADFIKEIRRITAPMLERKKIVFETTVEDGVIAVDRELFVTVFINLIDNARKASQDGAVIGISGCRVSVEDEEWYEFTVADNGVGMTEEEVSRMCDEFYMADKSRARKEGGAGIGMALVSLILNRHGAVWRVESEPGQGTRIYISVKEWRREGE